MGPVNQLSPTQNSETLFREQLQSLSQKGILNENLLIKIPSSSIFQTIKKFRGYQDSAYQRLVELKILRFLTEGRQWIKTPEDIALVKTLEEKLGLTKSNHEKPSELLALIHEICMPAKPQILSDTEQKQDKDENQQGTLTDDQATSTSQEDSHPQEHQEPILVQEKVVPRDQPMPNMNVESLVIPESLSTDVPASPILSTPEKKVSNFSEAMLNKRMALREKTLKKENIDWIPAAKAAAAAASTFALLGSAYLFYPSSLKATPTRIPTSTTNPPTPQPKITIISPSLPTERPSFSLMHVLGSLFILVVVGKVVTEAISNSLKPKDETSKPPENKKEIKIKLENQRNPLPSNKKKEEKRFLNTLENKGSSVNEKVKLENQFNLLPSHKKKEERIEDFEVDLSFFNEDKSPRELKPKSLSNNSSSSSKEKSIEGDKKEEKLENKNDLLIQSEKVFKKSGCSSLLSEEQEENSVKEEKLENKNDLLLPSEVGHKKSNSSSSSSSEEFEKQKIALINQSYPLLKKTILLPSNKEKSIFEAFRLYFFENEKFNLISFDDEQLEKMKTLFHQFLMENPLELELEKNQSIQIPVQDYKNFIEKKDCNIQKAYTAILMLNRLLNDKKEKCYNPKTGEIVDPHALQLILHSLEVLERDKEKIFKTKLEEEKIVNQNIEQILNTFEDIVGSCFVPVDYKMALLEFVAVRPDRNKLMEKYFKLASNPDKLLTINNPESKQISNSFNMSSLNLGDSFIEKSDQITCLEALPRFFEKNVALLSKETAFGSKEIASDEGDFRRSELYTNLKKMHLFLLHKLGGIIDPSIITGSMKINGLNSETEVEKDQDVAIRKEQAFLPFLPKEEQAFSKFHSYDQYGIKVKNEWERDNTKVCIDEIICTSTFAIKQRDRTYEKVMKEIKVNCENINYFMKDNEKFIIQFIQVYCQASEKERKLLEDARNVFIKNDLKDVLMSKINPQETERNIIMNLKNNHNALITICQEFASQVTKRLKEVASFKAAIQKDDQDNLEKIPDESWDEIDLFEIDYQDVKPDTDDENEDKDEEKKPMTTQPSTIWGKLCEAGKVVREVGKVVGTAAYNVTTKVVSTATKVVNDAIEIIYDDPDWVKEKFRFSVSKIFENEKLSEYLKEMDKKDETDELLKLVMDLFKSENPTKDNARNNHTEFVTKLRDILEPNLNLILEINRKPELFQIELRKRDQSNKPLNPLVNVVLEICRLRFEGGDNFYPFFDKIMSEDLGLKEASDCNKLKEEDFGKIKNALKEKNIGMCQTEVLLGCVQGHSNIKFDPHLNGNIPYVLAKLTINDKERTLLRMGSPTIQGFTGKAQINPEFKGFLEWLKIQGKSHLYISLQNDKAKMIGTGDETARSQAIKDLQDEYKDVFFAVILAQDSHFYEQVDAKEKPITHLVNEEGDLILDEDKQPIPYTWDHFKEDFKKEMLKKENTGFYFPVPWKTEGKFKDNIDRLLELVHKVIFDDKPQLDREERLDFIEIFYAYLSVFLMHWKDVNYCNISCKDAIDRAGKLNSLVLQLFLTKAGLANRPPIQHIHRVLTHSGALWVKGKSILPSRRGRLISAFNRMYDRREEIRSTKVEVASQIGNSIISLIQEQGPIEFLLGESKQVVVGKVVNDEDVDLIASSSEESSVDNMVNGIETKMLI